MEFCEEIFNYFNTVDRPVLFAGAGVSATAGLPTWGDYMNYLAQQVQPHDAMTCHHMRELVRDGDYIGAASQYFLSKKIPQQEKYKKLALPFSEYDISGICVIGKLPFSAYVTTNYDRVLFDVYASEKKASALEVNLNDPTLSAAEFNKEFYVARIHGRVEVTDTMMMSDLHYDEMLRNDAYVDFLVHCFTRKNLVFVGFSFLDPAIRQVLGIIGDRPRFSLITTII